jgi:hypothetical protein
MLQGARKTKRRTHLIACKRNTNIPHISNCGCCIKTLLGVEHIGISQEGSHMTCSLAFGTLEQTLKEQWETQ